MRARQVASPERPARPGRWSVNGSLLLAAAAAAAGLGALAWLVVQLLVPPTQLSASPARTAPVEGIAATSGASPAASPASSGTGEQFTAKLRASGAGACAGKIDELASNANANVTQFNTVSTWAMSANDRRLVSVSIGQKYVDGGAVPYAATSVIAAPSPLGTCDALALQVVPSPLPCAKVRENLGSGSQHLGDIAGIPLMRNGDGQTMLVPTSGNGCVLVGLRTAYAK